ncbi:MAG: VWA domain-containing protein [Chitinophagales bacterium]|nr:VWA domain-containing protein [Bacteroidota bacterium]MCB9043607.1 VWA domain-containing protein [Chitinophagales bacterium]
MLSIFKNLSFEQPYFLLLLLAIPLYFFWQKKRKKPQTASFSVPSLKGISFSNSLKKYLLRILPYCWLAALALLIIALARPQKRYEEQKIFSEGIDIVMALDISGSMLARDFEPDRLEAAKATVENFIDERESDRIGLVVFAGESFTQCPLTTDHQVLKKLCSELRSGLVEEGTAIGLGLATSVNRLRESDAKSKIIILLTDGENNKGNVDPVTAANIAQTYGIKVYTIGVGTRGKAPYPTQDIFGRTIMQYQEVNIDEDLLREIARITGGKYFRATDNKSLTQIYDEIDSLEKTKIESTTISRYTEYFRWFAVPAFILMLLLWLLQITYLRSIQY